ncbi:MAG: arginine--tRNA ligase [Cytophagales bacterium]|nr:arginine--tRNA ligase [Armatimonadota bacterium]
MPDANFDSSRSVPTPQAVPLAAYAHDRLRAEATEILAATGLVTRESVTLALPKPSIPADLAFPVFAAAKAAGQNPGDFSQRLADAAVVPEGMLIGAVTAQGGFVNFAVHPAAFAAAVIEEVEAGGAAYGNDKIVGAGQKTVVEFSSPNIARKMHVGHLRSTVIGHSLVKILAALGYDVISDNHLGDWGTQFGTLLAAIDNDHLTPWDDPDPVQSLVEVYARFNSAAKDDPTLMDSARAWFKRLEDGDPWARQTWQRLIDLTLVEFDKTYRRLGVAFDTTHGESYFEPMLAPVVQEALDKKVAHIEPGGAVVVEFGEESRLPSCLLRKTDGATLYQTRDAATCLYRWREYAPVRNIYVVGAEQKLHFQQVFEIVRRMGYKEIADRSIHIAFGAIVDAGGQRFSMRKGTAIFLEEVLDEAVTRARALMQASMAEGRTEITPEEVDSVSEMLGIGAVIYADLYQGPERGIKFDWDKILANEGNTGAYLQYTHARCRSILRKALPAPGAETLLLVSPEEQAVLKQLSRLPHAIREAGANFAPSTVADWTYNLAKAFNDFYHSCPVLKAETSGLREARLALVAAVAQGLKNGLGLLGIGAPERM